MTTRRELKRYEVDLLRNRHGDRLLPPEALDEPVTARYVFDRSLIPTGEWGQMDTAQDAWYYGMWTSPAERRVIEFAEGDISDTVCTTDREYVDAVRAAVEFHQRNESWKWIDPWRDAVRDSLEKLGLGNLLHPDDRKAAAAA